MKYCITAFLCIITLRLYAQQPQFRAQKMSYADQEVHLRTMFQDQAGFVWLGTDEGLFRYDGSVMEQYLLPGGDSADQVSALHEDQRNRIWVGTGKGHIYYLENNTVYPFVPQEGLPKVKITSFVSDRSGRLWFSTYGEGMYCLHHDRLYNFNTGDGLSDDYLYTLFAHPSGLIITGSDAGMSLVRFDQGKKEIRTIDQRSGLPDNIITFIKSYDNHSILAGTQSRGVIRFNLKSHRIDPFTAPAGWDYGAVSSIATSAGYWYYATSEKGIIQADAQGRIIQVFNAANSSVSNKSGSLLSDREGNIWISDHTSRVITFNSIFTFISLKELHPGSLYAVFKDAKGMLWFSDNKHVYAYKDNRFITLPDRLKSIPAISIYEDHSGYLWFGTFGKGVYRYHAATGELELFTEKNGLVNNNVLSISGTEKEIWFATLGGVSRCLLKPASGEPAFVSFNGRNNFDAQYVYQVYAGSGNRIWFATDGHGVLSYEPAGGFTKFDEAKGLSSKIAYGITEDSNHHIWVNAAQGGVFCGDGLRFDLYPGLKNVKQHLISSIFADRQNNLLLVNRYGIDVLNINSGMLLHHSDELGLESIEPNLNAGCVDAAGNIWLGMQQGIIKYTPSGNLLWKGPAPVIKKISLYLKELAPGHPAEFTYDENHITFEYAGLWYHDPDEVVYQIRLEGYDGEWIRTKDRSVTYPRLPPGQYTFRLKVSADLNLIHTREVTYTFIIRKPFWGTWWFRLMLLLGCATLIYGLIRQREKKLKEKERFEKDTIAFQFETLKSQINPHFLFNSFNTLAALIETDAGNAVSYVEQLSDFYRSILQYRDKDMIPLTEELQLLANYFFLQQKRYGDKLSLQVDEDLAQGNYFIAPLTLQLLMENAVKHNIISTEQPLSVRISKEHDYLVVSNNYQPKHVAERSTGTGLQNIQSRYRILTRQNISVEKDAGTFSVKIPLIT